MSDALNGCSPSVEYVHFTRAIMSALVAAVQLFWYSKFLLPVYGLIGAAVYIVMLRFLRIVDSGDLDLLQRFLGRRLSIVNSILRWMLLA